MTPEELAARHPRLYHVTEPGAWASVAQKGLLSTTRLLDLFEIEAELRIRIETKRRPAAVPLEHPTHGRVIINDNQPLNEKALTCCLDGGLTPADWLRLLNSRVFFLASEEGLNRLLGARFNRHRPREVIVINTLSLATAHAERIELCPINSGSTLRKAARRGLDTFTPLLHHSFKDWSKHRGRRDQILEITVRDHVTDITHHMIDVFQTSSEITS
ncbi:MAG: hypothetical protein K2W92_04035 [Alphaproteobacteria bacterium]|nr:hypothetical protein [Alphaproteobacteria bacterium]